MAGLQHFHHIGEVWTEDALADHLCGTHHLNVDGLTTEPLGQRHDDDHLYFGYAFDPPHDWDYPTDVVCDFCLINMCGLCEEGRCGCSHGFGLAGAEPLACAVDFRARERGVLGGNGVPAGLRGELMSVRALTWALDSGIDPLPRLVLIYLSDDADDEGFARFLGVSELATRCHLSEPDTSAGLSALEELGLVITFETAAMLVMNGDYTDGLILMAKKLWGGPTEIRRLVMKRDGYQCQECGSTSQLSIDHRVPRSKGGSSYPPNLQVLCMPCNMRKGAR